MDCCKQDDTVKKVIAVIGATGKQGGGLVQAILDDPKGGFSARALTRDPTKGKAVTLKNQGADVVKFDMDDTSTHAHALKGVYGLFVLTNYWEHFSIEKEQHQVQTIVAAAEIAGVKHIIWSTLEGTTEFFDSLPESERPNKIGGYYVPHFDGKAECNQLFPSDKTTFLYTCFYLENLSGNGMIKDGVWTINMGDSAPLPVIACEDIGKCAYGIFKADKQYMGKNVYIAGDVLSCEVLMDTAWDATGQRFEYNPVDRETYANIDFPGANDIANMFYFQVKNKDFAKNRDPNVARALNPKLQTARAWMEKNVDALTKIASPAPEAPKKAASTKAAPTGAAASPTKPVSNVDDDEEELWA